EVAALLQPRLVLVAGRLADGAIELRLEQRLAVALRIRDVPHQVVAECLQRVRSRDPHPSLRRAVAVDVGDGLRRQLLLVLLDPLRGSEQAPFFAVPRRQPDRPRPPPRHTDTSARGVREPVLSSTACRRAVSISATWPRVGSAAPLTHAS